MIDGDSFYIKSEYVYCQLESTAQMSLQSSSEERESVLSAAQLLGQVSSPRRCGPVQPKTVQPGAAQTRPDFSVLSKRGSVRVDRYRQGI